MKSKLTISFLILLLIIIICYGYFKVSFIRAGNEDDIDKLLNAASFSNSAFWATYIGEVNGYVYIEYETMIHLGGFISNKSKKTLYKISSKEISEEDIKKFIEYKKAHEINYK